jgi:ribosomal protein S18 acetylase RimI-like enzyme
VIRPIRPQDADVVFGILEDSRVAGAYPIGPLWTLAQVAQECSGPGWVCENSEGALTAFILFRDLGEALEVSFLATAINARGHGFMESLLRHLIHQKSPEKPVWLEVHVSNEPARRLYRKVGFREVGKRPRYYSDGGAAVLYNYG